MTDKVLYEDQRLIEVYCFAKKKSSRLEFLRDSKASILELLLMLATLVDIDKPLFTDEASAFDYARYIDNSYCIIKAYVLDQAIESRNQNLHLKKGRLQSSMVHGCYPSCLDTRVYVKNPNFEKGMLEEPLTV